jgi:hypothetical protein
VARYLISVIAAEHGAENHDVEFVGDRLALAVGAAADRYDHKPSAFSPSGRGRRQSCLVFDEQDPHSVTLLRPPACATKHQHLGGINAIGFTPTSTSPGSIYCDYDAGRIHDGRNAFRAAAAAPLLSVPTAVGDQAGHMTDIRAGGINVWDNLQHMPTGTGTDWPRTADTARLARPPGTWAHSAPWPPGYSRGQLSLIRRPDDTDRFWLPPSRLVSATIGRDMSNDLVLHDERVSRAHAMLVSTPAGVEIRDINSRNGTFINGARIGRALLRNGDFVTIGTTEFTVAFRGGIRLAAEALAILQAGRIRHHPSWAVGHARYDRRA